VILDEVILDEVILDEVILDEVINTRLNSVWLHQLNTKKILHEKYL
jgi:hypothetical protein